MFFNVIFLEGLRKTTKRIIVGLISVPAEDQTEQLSNTNLRVAR